MSAPHPDMEKRTGAADHLKAGEWPSSGYADFLAGLDLTRDELLAEAVRRHEDHAGACRLAFELYLAGTEQDNETFAGVHVDPVQDVKAHLAAVRARELP